jgi:hypothetical protein
MSDLRTKNVETTLTLMAPQSDLPLGNTWQCASCGTRLRQGQPHSAQEPFPHLAYGALIVHG